jgi:hypothetical protein
MCVCVCIPIPGCTVIAVLCGYTQCVLRDCMLPPVSPPHTLIVWLQRSLSGALRSPTCARPALETRQDLKRRSTLCRHRYNAGARARVCVCVYAFHPHLCVSFVCVHQVTRKITAYNKDGLTRIKQIKKEYAAANK